VFHKVLIANRGEIAVRVMHTCRRLGIGTVAVYSRADRAALHPRVADKAVEIGPPPASESYLVAERVIQAALDTGAEAIHPGYGFLAENAAFARAVDEAGLIWIGPPPEAIERMGDKLAARRTAEAAEVPVVPGSPVLDDAKTAKSWAEDVGYPVLLKASAGGGGKGMRVVQSEDALAAAFERARSEAGRSFGNPAVYLEKYVPHAKHIEMQVFSDAAGHHVWLGERECSIQRRHQKLIEESPSAALSEAERERIAEAAAALARGCDYLNAGTVEFLYDADAEAFYFLEMNTRLQVEHPVTEMVTGEDLVEWQLRVAHGESLPTTQDEIERHGVALECRVYAEDPQDFLPATGRLRAFAPPSGDGVRLDSGVEEGDLVSSFYDPLLAKLVVHGRNRSEAVARMSGALDTFAIAGVTTNLAFHRAVMDVSAFQQGAHLTDFIERFAPSVAVEERTVRTLAPTLAALVRRRESGLEAALAASPDGWPAGGRA